MQHKFNYIKDHTLAESHEETHFQHDNAVNLDNYVWSCKGVHVKP